MTPPVPVSGCPQGGPVEKPAASESRPAGASPPPADALFTALYAELRRLAAAQLRDRHGTLQPTALVHDAWLRMQGSDPRFHDRAHFLAAAATVIRSLLVDHDRRRRRQKRGGAARRTLLDSELADEPRTGLDLMDLEEALIELARLDARKARVVELRVFAGATLEEAAATLGVSRMTASNDWRMAKAWLVSRLGRDRGR
jgi:RNA polymerase sigma factor (TIGR02999 family)